MPNPGSARTAEEFVVLLREARARSGLTYWELEQKAEAAGHRLDPAKLVEALGLSTVPDQTLVVALLAACGLTAAETATWLAARDRLAAGPPSRAACAATDTAGQTGTRPADLSGDLSAALSGETGVLPAVRSAAVDEKTVLTPVLATGPAAAPQRNSLARALVTALAVLVAGVGSVAVIISAVNSGEAAGPPVYAPGAQPPRTAPVPQPSETAAEATPTPAPSASPPLSPAASRPAAPRTTPPQPGVLRSGSITLQSGQGIDLDGGGRPDIVAYGGDTLRAEGNARRLAAGPTASRQACAAVTGYQRSMQDLAAGSGICVHTDEGRYAHLTVTRTAPLAFSYVVWS